MLAHLLFKIDHGPAFVVEDDGIGVVIDHEAGGVQILRPRLHTSFKIHHAPAPVEAERVRRVFELVVDVGEDEVHIVERLAFEDRHHDVLMVALRVPSPTSTAPLSLASAKIRRPVVGRPYSSFIRARIAAQKRSASARPSA
jgi:hypothetical protein